MGSRRMTLIRSLVLTLALALPAVLFSLPSAGAQEPAPQFIRALPTRVTAATTPRRDRYKPYTFTTTGNVIPPKRYCDPGESPGFGPANCTPIFCLPGTTDVADCTYPGTEMICSGRVRVRIQKAGVTISSRRVTVTPDCTYSSRVSFASLPPARRGTLLVQARFQGNVLFLPRNSSRQNVRAG